MNSNIKKIFSVTLALITGVGIVFFAWIGDTTQSNKVSFEPTVSGDSWKDSLRFVPVANPSKILGISQQQIGEEATTTTGKIARVMLIDYALMVNSSATTTISDAEADVLAQRLTDKVRVAQDRQYTIKDLKISTDNSTNAFATYSNEVIRIASVLATSRTKNDLEIAFMSPNVDPTAKKIALEQNATQYENFIKSMLATKTPSGISTLHLQIIQTYSVLKASVQALANAYTDPLTGLAALAQYREGVDALVIILKEHSEYLSKNK